LPEFREADEPALAGRGVASFHHAEQGLVDRPDAHEVEHIVFEALDAVGAEVPFVEERRHRHRHDDPCRAPDELLLPAAGPFLLQREPRAQHLL
jgi:hypothetical protein